MRGNHSSYLVRDVCSMAVSRSALNPIARMWESLFDLEFMKDTQLALPGGKRVKFWRSGNSFNLSLSVLLLIAYIEEFKYNPSNNLNNKSLIWFQTLTLCKGMISFSESFSEVKGWIQSFFIIFSTHSIVTTSPLKWT